MKVLFLGTFFPDDEIESVKKNSKKTVQNAANLLQWDYINGFESIYKNNVLLITKMCIGTFPNNYRKMFIKTRNFSSKNGSVGISVGFPNFYPIKQFLYPKICYKFIKKWIYNYSKEEKIIIAYSTLCTKEILKIKKIDKNIRIVLIVPDLPYYMNLDKNNMLYKIKRLYETKKLEECLKEIDAVVPITKYMENEINSNRKLKSVIIEGMINSKKSEKHHVYKNYFQFCYAGTLTKKYGIINLINDFRKIKNDNIRLVICGGGEMVREVEKSVKEDKRIIYKGVVSSDEAYEIQCQSDVLINPRMNDSEYIKFSFPSKILQYMKTGRPIICYKLDGIPDEYDNYLLFVNDGETLKSKMEFAIKMSHKKLDEIGRNAEEFVLNEKNNIVQVKKIVRILGENDDNKENDKKNIYKNKK